MARKKWDGLEVVVWDSETQGENCISQTEIRVAFETTVLTKLRKSKAFKEAKIKKRFLDSAFRKFRTKYYRDNFKPEMFSSGWLKIADCWKPFGGEYQFSNVYDFDLLPKYTNKPDNKLTDKQRKDNETWLDYLEKVNDDVEVIDDGGVIGKLLDAFPVNTYAYAYNSSGWDSHFILVWMLEKDKNYIDVSRMSGEELAKVKNNFNNKYVDGVYEIVCDDKNKIYELSVERWRYFEYGGDGEPHVSGWEKQNITFQCAWLKFPGSIRKFGREIGFNKGDDFDYTKNRSEKTVLNEQDRNYQKRDVTILAVCVHTFADIIGHKGFAVSGGALRLWKKLRYKHILQNENYIQEYTDKNGKEVRRDLRKGLVEKAFKQDYPNAIQFKAENTPGLKYDEKGNCMLDEDMLEQYSDTYMNWQHAKESYMGGITYLNGKFKNILITNNPKYYVKKYPHSVINNIVVGYDISSSYPSNMYNKELPCGHYIVFTSMEEWAKQNYQYGFAVFDVKINSATIKTNSNNHKYIPFFPKKGGAYGSYSYIEDVKDERRYISNIDMSNLLDFYEVDYEIITIYAYKTRFYQFEEYVELCYQMKETTIGVEREFWKVLMNGLYGKFGMGYEMTNRYWYRDDVSDYMKYQEFDSAGDGVYMPMACAITSWARDNLINAIQCNCHRFIYCDTDSMYLIGGEEPEGIYFTRDYDGIDMLGKWACEGTYGTFIASRPKVYIKHAIKDKNDKWLPYWREDTIVTKFAGCRNIPSIDYLIDNFIKNEDFVIPKGKVQSVNCKRGGKVILNVDYTYTIKHDFNEEEELQNLAIDDILEIENDYIDDFYG